MPRRAADARGAADATESRRRPRSRRRRGAADALGAADARGAVDARGDAGRLDARSPLGPAPSLHVAENSSADPAAYSWQRSKQCPPSDS